MLGALVLLVPLARGRLETTAVLDATVPGGPHDLPTAVTDIAIGGDASVTQSQTPDS